MSKTLNTYQEPTREEIAACAYLIYEREGRSNGRATQHWLEAEAQLVAEGKAKAGIMTVKATMQSATGNGHGNRKAGGVPWTAPSRSRQTVHAN